MVLADAIAAFHAHLDACAQCRDRPLDLCPAGVELLRAFARAMVEAR